jgi:hypothetical protein
VNTRHPVKASTFKLTLLAAVCLTPVSLTALDPTGLSLVFTPVLSGEDIYSLSDSAYQFPANYSPRDKMVYLTLRRWDLIFTGDRANVPQAQVDSENVNRLIPGPFNHIMVYMGKDSRGLAYAVELNTGGFDNSGGLRLICLGSDYGVIRHPEFQYLQDRRYLNRRWAMRFREDVLAQLKDAESVLLARIKSDLVLGFPYQLEFAHSGSLFDPKVHIIDDGFRGGAGCSDYWTTLFEQYADVCLKGVRLTAEELEAYFLTDPEGLQAYAPPEISPFSDPVSIAAIIGLGFYAVPDAPHVFPCDQSEETGLVLPSLIMESPMLEEIPAESLPFGLPSFVLEPGN